MATTPTQNAVPSQSPFDFKFNIGKIDEFVTSQGWTYTDRFGQKHYTIEGINYLSQQAMAAYGYVILTGKTFTTGATLTNPNEVLLNTADGEYYKWTGSFASGPKTIPQNSTPASTGGTGPGAWIGVGDASLRSALAGFDGTHMVYHGNKPVSDYLPFLTSQYNISASNSPQVNAQNLNRMIDEGLAAGRTWIDVDVFATVDDITVPVRKKTEMFFRNAGGELTGLYRRAAIPAGAPSNVRVTDGLAPGGMYAFYAADKLKVVSMGDSIAMPGPDALSSSDAMASIIAQQITLQNRERSVNFVNMAIGGQTWINAAGKPTAFPAWYQDTSKTWLEYVKAESPDLLILAFGMNDANGFNATAMHLTIKEIKSWTKVPSLLFVTTPVPSMATTINDNYYKTVFQEGRDQVAGYVRSYASHYGHSLLDMNRQFCLIRDGRDYVGVPLHRAGVYNQSYIHDTTLIARDFTLKGDVASWPVGKVLSVKVGSGELDLVYITNTGGKYRVDAFCTGDKPLSGPIAPYVNLTTEIPVATGQTLDISVQNNTFTLFAGITQVVTFPIIRTGGELAVVAEWQGEPGAGPFVSLTVQVGNWLQCQYTARDSDIWGPDDGTADMKLPGGGNGINHYSSNGLNLIVRPVVEAFDFRRRVAEKIVNLTQLLAGTTIYAGPLNAYRRGTEIALSGSVKRAGTGDLIQLPAGCRPGAQRIVSVPVLGSGGWAAGVLNISDTGVVTLASGDGSVMISLDGVKFAV